MHIQDGNFYITQQLKKYIHFKYFSCYKKIFLPIGKPIAKSLLCVQNIAKIPALSNFRGLVTNKVIIITEKNTILFATNIDKRKSQFTSPNSNSAKDRNIRAGSEKLPTKVPIPLASVSEIKFIRPAKYL